MKKYRKHRWDMTVYDSRINRWFRWLADRPSFTSFTLDTMSEVL